VIKADQRIQKYVESTRSKSSQYGDFENTNPAEFCGIVMYRFVA
jgi:hypothetical protein